MIGGSDISWTICKSFAPHSRQITTPAPHHSVVYSRMLFLMPNQQCQSTEDNSAADDWVIKWTRMWASAQRDGRPVKYRWRPLFNAAKFGWRPLLECRAVTLLRRKTRWNLLGCPKLTSLSQPLVGRNYEDMWKRYCCLASFFSDCRYMPYIAKI